MLIFAGVKPIVDPEFDIKEVGIQMIFGTEMIMIKHVCSYTGASSEFRVQKT